MAQEMDEDAEEELQELDKIFAKIDSDNDGQLSWQELVKGAEGSPRLPETCWRIPEVLRGSESFNTGFGSWTSTRRISNSSSPCWTTTRAFLTARARLGGPRQFRTEE